MGVKACSTACAKNNAVDLNDSAISAKRRKTKKAQRLNIEATASMTLKNQDTGDNSSNTHHLNLD